MNRNSFEVKIDIKDDDGLKKLLRECEEATKQGLIDGTTELVLYIGDDKIIYTGKREGEWLDFKCSLCGITIDDVWISGCEYEDQFNFCPVCGAKMKF